MHSRFSNRIGIAYVLIFCMMGILFSSRSAFASLGSAITDIATAADGNTRLLGPANGTYVQVKKINDATGTYTALWQVRVTPGGYVGIRIAVTDVDTTASFSYSTWVLLTGTSGPTPVVLTHLDANLGVLASNIPISAGGSWQPLDVTTSFDATTSTCKVFVLWGDGANNALIQRYDHNGTFETSTSYSLAGFNPQRMSAATSGVGPIRVLWKGVVSGVSSIALIPVAPGSLLAGSGTSYPYAGSATDVATGLDATGASDETVLLLGDTTTSTWDLWRVSSAGTVLSSTNFTPPTFANSQIGVGQTTADRNARTYHDPPRQYNIWSPTWSLLSSYMLPP